MATTDDRTPLPDFGDALDERATLVGFLQYYRVVLARKAEGISDEQARLTPCPPSEISLMGLIRHMAEVEGNWGQRAFAGGTYTKRFYGEAHPTGDDDGDFHPAETDTMAEAFAAYWEEIAIADAIYADAPLDQIEGLERSSHNLRWILVHLIEEYARHCGHADLIREAIDGVVDD